MPSNLILINPDDLGGGEHEYEVDDSHLPFVLAVLNMVHSLEDRRLYQDTAAMRALLQKVRAVTVAGTALVDVLDACLACEDAKT